MKACSSFANVLHLFAMAAVLVTQHDSLFLATAENVSPHLIGTIENEHDIQDTHTGRRTNDLCAAIITQKDALLALKTGLIDSDTTKLADWVNTTDPCADEWSGITCSGSDVTEITLCKCHLSLPCLNSILYISCNF